MLDFLCKNKGCFICGNRSVFLKTRVTAGSSYRVNHVQLAGIVHANDTCRLKISFKMLLTSSLKLPPANEVWGKVLFLHLSDVKMFTGGVAKGRCVVKGVS